MKYYAAFDGDRCIGAFTENSLANLSDVWRYKVVKISYDDAEVIWNDGDAIETVINDALKRHGLWDLK